MEGRILEITADILIYDNSTTIPYFCSKLMLIFNNSGIGLVIANTFIKRVINILFHLYIS